MCHRAKVLTIFFIMTEINAEITDDHHQGYTINSNYAPSTLNFDDIYTNSLPSVTEEQPLTRVPIDDYNLNNIPAQFVEFHPQTTTNAPVTIPPPKYLSREALLEKENLKTVVETTTTTTEEPEERSVRVIPIEQEHQRGVLDLLFPATRVRTFKNMFDSTIINEIAIDKNRHGYPYNSYYTQSTLKVNNIVLSVTDGQSNAMSIEDFDQNIPIHFVEFNPLTITNLPLKIALPNIISIKALKTKENSKLSENSATTEGPKDSSVGVIPIEKKKQLGVLDLLFPASRVQSFKSVFDSMRHILSHTFRR